MNGDRRAGDITLKNMRQLCEIQAEAPMAEEVAFQPLAAKAATEVTPKKELGVICPKAAKTPPSQRRISVSDVTKWRVEVGLRLGAGSNSTMAASSGVRPPGSGLWWIAGSRLRGAPPPDAPTPARRPRDDKVGSRGKAKCGGCGSERLATFGRPLLSDSLLPTKERMGWAI